ncbi:hypothetical protein BOTNAR_0021g00460 [Botryotinia narcissicola]|uniref:Uncharacterized protein n=1 Tax=Botryotinia narcissicola TaxID=278944 RepID=A0A4Z1JIA0_9HELO|nr:hypothetical protein BOTNAR_0021g00460 [Botryotinia narcissicola]
MYGWATGRVGEVTTRSYYDGPDFATSGSNLAGPSRISHRSVASLQYHRQVLTPAHNFSNHPKPIFKSSRTNSSTHSTYHIKTSAPSIQDLASIWRDPEKNTSAPALRVVERVFGYKTSFPSNAFIVEELRFRQLKKLLREMNLSHQSNEGASRC